MSQPLSSQEITAATAELPGWRALAGRLHLTVTTGDFVTGVRFVDRVAALAEEQDHHPDLDLRWGLVHVAVSSHDVGGLTRRDLRLAAAIVSVVDEMGLQADVASPTVVELAIDALDIQAVRPFWAAVLGGRVQGDVDVVDPATLLPLVWFQQMDEPRPQRNRIHVDVWVTPDEAPRRLSAALAAGGRLVSDTEAPSFWILADAEGNEACICTSLART